MNKKLLLKGHELSVLNRYYIWLVDMIDFNSHDTYSKLLEYLFNTNYIWMIWTDENRAGDGKKLRERFQDETDYLDYSPLVRPCSVLEMLIAFAERINIDVMEEEYTTAYWFWLMLDNLGLEECKDKDFNSEIVEKVLNTWLTRNFERNGKSGIFPQKSGRIDQTKVDFWFQMQQYIAERYEN